MITAHTPGPWTAHGTRSSAERTGAAKWIKEKNEIKNHTEED